MSRKLPPSEILNFIARVFPKEREGIGWEYGGNLSALTHMIDALDESQLPNEAALRADLFAATGQIEHMLSMWASGTRSIAHFSMPGYGSKMPIEIVRECLSHCRDAIIPIGTAGLEFIVDIEYRRSLQEDLAGFEVDLNNREWKSATMLGGSLIEALLLDALLLIEDTAKKAKNAQLHKGKALPLLKWDLFGLIPTAEELGIRKHKTSELANNAREFRDFIHPGREKRLGARCSGSTAFTVKSALLAVIDDLTNWHAARARPED